MRIFVLIIFMWVCAITTAQQNKLDSLIKIEDYNSVLNITNQQLEQDSLNVKALYYKGLSLEGQFKSQKAYSIYKRILSIDSLNYLALSKILSIYIDNNTVDSAIDVALRILSLRPNNIKTYYTLALLNNKVKKYNVSLSYCDSALAIYPRFVKCLALKASNLIEIKDTLNAIPIYINLFNNTHKNRFVRQCVFLSWNNRYKDTVSRVLDNAIINDSSNSYLYKMKGYFLYQLSDYDKAEINLNKAYEMGDSSEFTIKYLALTAYRNQDYSTAYDFLEKIDNVLREPNLLYMLAISHQRVFSDTTSLNLLNLAFNAFYNVDILESIKSEMGQTACSIGDRYQNRHKDKLAKYYLNIAEQSYKQALYFEPTNTTQLRLVTLYDYYLHNVKSNKQILNMYQQSLKAYNDTASSHYKFIKKRIRKYKEIVHFE